MTTHTVTLATVTVQFTELAMLAIQETEADVQCDFDALVFGEHTRESLLAHCLDGVETEDDVEGWTDYVSALVMAVEASAVGDV